MIFPAAKARALRAQCQGNSLRGDQARPTRWLARTLRARASSHIPRRCSPSLPLS